MIILNGTPFENQSKAKDQQKIDTIGRYRSHIENYYGLQRKIPATVAEAQSALSSTQPEIDPSLEYKVTGEYTYEFCSSFESSNLEQYQRLEIQPDPNSSIVSEAHGQGYACLKYRIPQYLIDNKNTSPVRELPIQKP